MKSRLDQWIIVIGFCTFLGIMAALYLLLPKAEYSQLEKRYLEESPSLTVKTLTTGQYGQDVESYMADHIPGRSFFVGLHAYARLLTGGQAAEEIYPAEDHRLVEAPVIFNEEQAQKNVAAVNRIAEALNCQVDLMILPSAGWAVEDSVWGISKPYRDSEYITRLYDMAGENVSTVDMVTEFQGAEDMSALYYKTDHHWTSLGAYTACKVYMTGKDRAYPEREEFTVKQADGFQGSTYSRAGLWMTPSETLEMWERSQNLTVTNGENQAVHRGAFYDERLQEADKYTVFLDGNHSVVRIENPENKGKGSILVIRDSYANCLGSFLAESYETVVLVDLRYYKQPVTELYAQEGFEDVLVCYSLSNFMTDNNLVWLK